MTPAPVKRWRKKNKEKYAAYRREWYAKNRAKPKAKLSPEERAERRKLSSAKYRQSKRDQALKNEAAYRERNRDACNARIRSWKRANSAKVAESKRARSASLRVPPWASRAEIIEVYRKAQELGPEWHVDHIVPLQGKIVCGLHCADNLQIIPARDNLRKNRHQWPDMP